MQHFSPDPAHTHDGHYVGPDFDGPIEEHPLWQRDNVILVSVGIDVGSAGTQILFSQVHLKRQSVDLSSRYLVVSRETLYQSPIMLTPYSSETLIDARRLGEIVDEAYFQAKLHPESIDTGVVILTGEALRRENAERIAHILSEKCGDVVCATAGHHMEAMLAAHGSGAVQASFVRNERVLNVDVGGGTTKLTVIDKGRVLSTAAIHIGARLLAFDANGRLARLDPAGRLHARRAGFDWRVGDAVREGEVAKVAQSMADDLVAALTGSAPPARATELYLTDPISHLANIDSVMFSGGVAEFVYHREPGDFGDLGRPLGGALRAAVDSGRLPWRLLSDSLGIRSTVLGCSEFTAQVSGNTGYLSNPDRLLPRRNAKVIRPDFEFAEVFDADALADAIRRHMTRFEIAEADPNLVLAFHWEGAPRFERLAGFAEGIRRALAGRIARRQPIYVILDADIALNLGSILHRELEVDTEVMVIDGLSLWDFDSVDLGNLRLPSRTVPVTIKSLVFSDVADGVRRRELIHHPREGALSGTAGQGR
ncbi:MAG TPA: ethanolamine ammonia-lyase reactivating factor EutA [Woeseiaceae bacterium]|nr:ethanolamine ammonia-lyase reactivating factor EutA [Woeseiaceae bacterium]